MGKMNYRIKHIRVSLERSAERGKIWQREQQVQRSWGRENCNVWEEKSWCRWSPVVETRDEGPEVVINTASLHAGTAYLCPGERAWGSVSRS